MSLFNFTRRPNVQTLKAKQDVEGLIDALAFEDDHNVRQSAAWALGEIGTEEAVEPLVNALEDRKLVREVAAKSLGEIGDARAVEPLISLMEDDTWDVRGTAARALGKIGDDSAIDMLIKALSDENGSVRWYAGQALETITGEAFGDDAEKWAEWQRGQDDRSA
jgi:HEAT repeat protein